MSLSTCERERRETGISYTQSKDLTINPQVWEWVLSYPQVWEWVLSYPQVWECILSYPQVWEWVISSSGHTCTASDEKLDRDPKMTVRGSFNHWAHFLDVFFDNLHLFPQQGCFLPHRLHITQDSTVVQYNVHIPNTKATQTV